MESVRTEVRDGVAEVTLCRPERLNAFDEAMLDGLASAIAAADADGRVGAILLTGEGRGFCAGMDLTTATPPADGTSLGTAIRREIEQRLNPVVLALVGSRVPVVTAVNGVAAGGGMGLALCGDVVLAARSASFVQVFAPRLGIAPDTGSTWHLGRLLGRARARGLALLGDRLDAETAERWGLVWRVVDDADLMDEARATAARLARGSTEALRWTRRLLDEAPTATLPDQLAREAEANGELVDGPDFLEGVVAFLEKREPRFSGAERGAAEE